MTTIDRATAEIPDVLFLADITRSEAHHVGAKAANLAELARARFPVPDGFVLTTTVFERFLQANGLGNGSSPEEVEAAPLPSEVSTALAQAAAQYGDVPLAVRSSSVAEDGADASFAGQYETVLDVRGAEALTRAVRRCWASAFSRRVAEYGARLPRDAERRPAMAVLVQRQVLADAAGVAFTANPVTGDRDETVVSAVRGLGERLVSGQATPDEWLVRGQEVVCRAATEVAIDADQARAVAELARRVEVHFGGTPQDVEWARAGAVLFLLQARPMTVLPEPVEWKAPLPGSWARHFRLGEWLGDPVTPLFESWLLTCLEERLHAAFQRAIGMPPSRPLHVVVNGWYFYSFFNEFRVSTLRLAWLFLRYAVPRLFYQPRRVAAMIPPLSHLAVELYVREWREQVLPRCLALIETAEAQLEGASPRELVELVDDLADAAGDYFFSITSVGGFAAKAEAPLAAFYRQHLSARVGGSYQSLLRGLYDPPATAGSGAIQSLDWFHLTLGEASPELARATDPDRVTRWARLVADRRAAEAEARTVLAGGPRRLARFDHLLTTAQRFAVLREEQISSFTRSWPVMRRAVLRLGEELRQYGVLEAKEDVFFLTRRELLDNLERGELRVDLRALATSRRVEWQRQRRLVPPLILGDPPPIVRRLIAQQELARGVTRPDGPGIRGVSASPGRATGVARIIRGFQEFDRLKPGDVLVAPVTTPAWTPLFARAAAVVTDTGGIACHSSIVAREYGIPAIVGCGNATEQIRTGQVVTVDGTNGIVEIPT